MVQLCAEESPGEFGTQGMAGVNGGGLDETLLSELEWVMAHVC